MFANIKSRYLILLAAGYVMAILTVAAAVWVASTPALKDIQREAKEAFLNKQVEAMGAVIDNLIEEVQLLARDPLIASVVVGEARSASRVEDLLGEADTFASLRLLDYRGREVAGSSHRLPSQLSRFPGGDSVYGTSDWDSGHVVPPPRVQYVPGESIYEAHFLIIAPVAPSGTVEGVLAAQAILDLSDLLRVTEDEPETVLATQFQRDNWEMWHGRQREFIATPLPRTDFYLIVDTDRKVLQTVGQRLVITAIVVAGVSLFLPFGLMGSFGMRAIVSPHIELEKSRFELSQKSSELKQLATISQMANEAILTTDANERITWANAAFTDISGYGLSEIIGRRPAEFLQGPDTDPTTKLSIRQSVRAREPVQAELVNYTKSGRPYWISLSIAPIVSDKGELQYAAISSDITAAKEAERQLVEAQERTRHQALHDPLTGLPNRRYLDEVLENDVAGAAEPRTLIRIDLDFFKHVNDTLGHAAGDHVLREVAKIVRQNIEADDLASRVGGDEFVILLGEGRSVDDAHDLTDQLHIALSREFKLDGASCRIGASFGISSAATGLITNRDLLKGADAALYIAKETGRNTAILYTPKIHQAVLGKRQLSVEIEQGLENGEFVTWFQPQFDARTERLAGVEALVRWNHPERGVLAPFHFLRVAEQLRLLQDIDRAVFDYGLDRICELNEMGRSVPKLSFNVGVDQLMDERFEKAMRRRNLGGTRLGLEILESVLVEEQDDEFLDRVKFLRDLGYSIEVDDFGSGHASIVGLKKLRPDVMKLDRLLVQPVDKDADARALARAMIEIGRTLDVSITAEGVEAEAHADIMRDLGCNTLQGYYFAQPMSFEDLLKFDATKPDVQKKKP